MVPIKCNRQYHLPNIHNYFGQREMLTDGFQQSCAQNEVEDLLLHEYREPYISTYLHIIFYICLYK